MNKIILTLLLVLLLVPSCVRDVTMDAMEDPEVVVECVLSDKPLQTLYLTYTKGASREKALVLPKASAVLTDLTEGNEVGRFERVSDGSWQMSYAAIPSHHYRLDISIPDHEPVWAEQTMPQEPSVEAKWNWWRENLPETNYRHVHGYVFSVDTLNTPVWFYGINHPEDVASTEEMTEILFTDFPEVDGFNELGSSMYDSQSERSLWGCYFGTSTYPDLDGAVGHHQYLRFPKREGERTEFLVSGDFRNCLVDPTDFVHSEKRFSELHYFASSEDYDKCLSDCYKMEQISASSNLSDMFIRDNIHSNINGATGIFGAKVEKTLLWDDDRYWGEGPFLLTDLKKKVDFTDISLFINWGAHHPFTILDYEVKAGHPEEWKYGPKYDTSKDIYSQGILCPIFSVNSDEELRAHGLDGYGPVDFSNKTVLVVYYTELAFNLPFLFDYFLTEDKGRGICYQTVHISQMINKGNVVSDYVDPFTSSRVALVVDKIDENAYKEVKLTVERDWIPLDEAPTYIFDTVLPEMGVEHPKK